MNYRCYQITVLHAETLPLPLPNISVSKTYVHKAEAMRSVDWIFIIGVPASL